MKKWQVFAAVLLLSVIALARLRQERAAEPVKGMMDGKILPAGVPLPRDTTHYFIPEELLAVPPQTGAPSSYGPLPTIKNEAYDRGPCPGGALNEILSEHGRLWGHAARHAPLEEEGTRRTYRNLERYLACVALSRGEPAFCDYLPAGSEFRNIGEDESPNFLCREAYIGAALPFFMAGKEKSDLACRSALAGRRMPDGRPVPVRETCTAAAGGMEKLCAAFAGRLDKKEMAECLRFAPAGKKDCRGDKDCLDRLSVYEAMKSGDASECPRESRGFCEALLSGTEAACSVMLVKLGSDYCSDLAIAQKKAGGFAGLSAEEVKEALAREKALKAEEEERRKEERAVEDRINKRVRRMLGRENGGEEPSETDRR